MLLRYRAVNTRGLGGHALTSPNPPPSQDFLHNKEKTKQRKKKKVSKQKLLKDCQHCQNNILLAILEHLEFKDFSCRPTMVAGNTFQCLHDPSNPFGRRYICV